jgi:hypothetical protein
MLGVYALNLALMGHTAEAATISIRSTQQPNAHYQATAFAAVTHALDGQLNRARELFARVRAVDPTYDLRDFLAVFRFRRDIDVRRIRKTFEHMRRFDRPH